MRCTAKTRAGKRCKNEAGSRKRCRFHQAKRVYSKTPDGILIRGAVRVAKRVPGEIRESWDAGKEPDPSQTLQALKDLSRRTTSRLASSKLTPKLGRVLAYGYIKADQRFIRHVAKRATRETAEKVLYFGIKAGTRVVSPGIGWALIGYDAYKLGKAVHEDYFTQ